MRWEAVGDEAEEREESGDMPPPLPKKQKNKTQRKHAYGVSHTQTLASPTGRCEAKENIDHG